MGDSTECREHSDCDFFDCRGRCDLLTHRCAGGVVNNNLQLVCEKVFLGGEGWAARGLLDSRHASIALRHAVAECANPAGQFLYLRNCFVHFDNGKFSGGEELARAGAGPETEKKMRKALKEVAEVAARLESSDD